MAKGLHVMEEGGHGGIDPVVIGGGGQHQVAAPKDLGDKGGDMGGGNVVHGDVLYPAVSQTRSQKVDSVLGVAVHGAYSTATARSSGS